MLVQQSKASKTPTSQVIRPPPIPYEYGTSHDLLVGFFLHSWSFTKLVVFHFSPI
jgi:hypothetical protein